MKRALWAVPLLVLVSAWSAQGAYSYYYTENGASPIWSNWILYTTSGQMVSQSYGGYSGITEDTAGAYGRMTYPSSSASPGEIKLTYRVANFPAGGVYTAVLLSASSDYYTSYYQVDISFSSSSSYYCLYKIVSGSYTSLACGYFGAAHDNMTLRVVRHSNGLILAYLDNVRFVQFTDTAFGAGRIGIVTSRPSADPSVTPVISQINLGNLDTTAPNAISSGSISVSPFSNHVDLQWPATSDDANGTGVYGYEIYRGGSLVGTTSSTSFSDTTVSPNVAYTYTLKVVDFHGNTASTNVNVTTPGGLESRRVGVRPTGAYWGTSGENIDVMSGNLNFTLPLVRAKARSGWGVTFNLNYNSQNWRYDANDPIPNWKYGVDIGYGWGWRLMAGSITPAYSDPYTVAYYLFTDSTGAEYRLDQNSSNVWSSKESIYVYFDANVNRLYFTDGSFWNFGATSASAEADSGVMYPTLMQDSNGNQVIVRYQTGTGASAINTSARITTIEDVRANNNTYIFTYNTNSPPHLTSIASQIGTGENYSFTYLTGQTLVTPFGSQSFGTTTMMRRVTVDFYPSNLYHEFSYNGSGELTNILLPYKGYLSYVYGTTAYANNKSYREVVRRDLSKDGISATQYPFSHESSVTTNSHQFTKLDDPGGVGEKYWTFATSGASVRLVTQYQGKQLQPSVVTKLQNDYTWAQDAAGNSYINSATTTADPGQSYAVAMKTTQTVDTHGNVTQVNTYNYGDLSTPMRTDNFTYLSYPSLYIFNRLTSSPTTTIAYDEFGTSTPPGDAHEWVAPGTTSRGNPTTITSPAGTQTIHYDFAGGVLTNTLNGLQSSISITNSTNYAAPSQVTVGSLSTTLAYNSFLGLTNETAPNSVTTTIGYDAMARPTSMTSSFGATTTNTYYDTYTPPFVVSTVNGRWTKTSMDGLGRTIKVETGYSGTTVSVVDTLYDSCGCSPTGKMTKTSLPHAPTDTPTWTTYAYDGIGRTTSVITRKDTSPDTISTTTYLYEGNTVKVSDAASQWKKYTTNALGQLIQVDEPSPAGGGATYVTSYEYDTLGHLKRVTMPRPTGTQIRTFNYGNPPGAQLLSATNPENGTVSYTYNSDKTLATKTDAKNQQVQYTYDGYKRVTQIRRGTYNGTFTEDTCQREDYTYDSGTYGLGRLSSIQYKGGLAYYNGAPVCDHTFTESFSYNSPGAITSQGFMVSEPARNYSQGGNISASLTASYTYDNERRVTATQYPSSWNGSSWVAGPNLGNTFDSMGRLQKLINLTASSDIISGTTYNPAGQLLTMTGANSAPSETRTYNSIGQMTRLQAGSGDITYTYPATQNNGKITSQTDGISGAQVVYNYDSLNRLSLAETATNPSVTQWGQSYTYDGFGNLTNQTTTKGSIPGLSVSYDPATNRRTGECADANGNINAVSFPNCQVGYGYDIENRIATQWNGAVLMLAYSYKPGNKRIWKGTNFTYDSQTLWTRPANEEFTFWSISGQKLVTYSLTQYQPGGPNTLPQLVATSTGSNYYFGGKLVKNTGGYVTPDRLGSIGKYLPYGQERPSATTDGKEKFATYFRDSETGLDYADQRYHQPGMGRFMSPDPFDGSASANAPASWNRYAYSGADPVNNNDPTGLDFDPGLLGSCVSNPWACDFLFDLSGPVGSASIGAWTMGWAGDYRLDGGSAVLGPPTSMPTLDFGFVDCAKACQKLQEALTLVGRRTADIVVRQQLGFPPDVNHINSLKDALGQLEEARIKVETHCGPYAGAAILVAAAYAALDAAIAAVPIVATL